ncbi:MAG: hypothetical protein V3V08_18290 [Nannocystaceae bacterium]
MLDSSDRPRRRIAYFVRTNQLATEARVARLFEALEAREYRCEVFGVVKQKSHFSHPCREYICAADRVGTHWLKLVAKLCEVQLAGAVAFFRHYRGVDSLVISNYEFLFLGLILRWCFGVRVVVDLHEHYGGWRFANRLFGRFLLLRAFSGVVFANRARADDFLGNSDGDSRVAIVRNFPYVNVGAVPTPNISSAKSLIVGIVGDALPGRFVRESIRSLDTVELATCIEIRTFGPKINESTRHVAVREHGPFGHWEIDELIADVDVSLVLYDPTLSANNRLCEPNRFFQAFNLGKTILCFQHPSLAQFYDAQCRIVDRENVAGSLRAHIGELVAEKRRRQSERQLTSSAKRQRLVFEAGHENLAVITS